MIGIHSSTFFFFFLYLFQDILRALMEVQCFFVFFGGEGQGYKLYIRIY